MDFLPKRRRVCSHIIISICFHQDWNKMEKTKMWFFTEVASNCQGTLEMSFLMQWWNCFINLPGYIRGKIVILRIVQPGKIIIFPKFWLTVCNRMVNETSCSGIVAKNADCRKLINVSMFCRGPSVSSEHLSFVS